MDVTQSLKDSENVLRDFLHTTLEKKLGKNWEINSGVSEARLLQWQERKEIENKSLTSGSLDERLIYYADFYDLETIIKKNWDNEFKDALGDQKEISFYLKILGKFRNPDAHRRELLPHQKSLVIGIAGEIRTKLVKYRSMKEDSSEDFYPKFDIVRDNYGNKIIAGEYTKRVTTILRPGDLLQFVLTASDPYGEELEFSGTTYTGPSLIKDSTNTFSLRITNEHVRKNFDIEFFIKSNREFHKEGSIDDRARFSYEVLPPKRK